MPTVQNIRYKTDKESDQKKLKDTFNFEVPGYKILEQCGEGATAKIYIAIQESLERQVALKIMLPAIAVDDERIHCFIKEGRVNAKLSHPNIVTIHDVGTFGEHQFIAMEYLPWGNLRQRLTKKLELDWVLNVAEQIASALAYAHENGYIHRDIKPENILFRNKNSAVLSDFGIAGMLDSRTQITSQCSLGTPRYMSPDQIRSSPIGPSSDVYSLGIVLFEMLTGKPPYNSGKPPYNRKDVVSVLFAHVRDPIPTLPLEYQHLQPLINKMLAKDCKERFINASEVVEVLAYLNKEGQLPPELTLKSSSAPSLNPANLLVDRQITVDEVSPLVNNDKQSPSSQQEDDNVSHIAPLPSDEVAAPQSATSLKSSGNELLDTFTKFVIGLKQTVTKGFLPSVALSVIFGFTSLALFLVYMSETSQGPLSKMFEVSRQLVKDISSSTQSHQTETVSINDLLTIAKEQIDNKNLTSPPNDNAYETYLRVLQSQADNPIAIAGISMIKKRYIDWAEQEIKKSNYHRGILFYRKAYAIDPTDIQLAQRLKELKSIKNIRK